MNINNIDSYKDGGTMRLDTTDGIYCIDDRIRTTTKGVVFKGYPEKDNSDILEALSEYEVDTFFDWKPRVYDL